MSRPIYNVIPMLLPADRGNHPNKDFADGLAEYITVHETANRTPGANAKGHGLWLLSAADYSWHETADDKEVAQHLRPHQQGWHAGDGFNGPGNKTSWALELCVAEGMDFARVREIGAHRVATLMKAGHGYKGVVQHNRWTGKDCPHFLRMEPGAWQAFIDRIQFHLLDGKEEGMADDEARAQLARLNEVLVKRELLRRLAADPDATRVESAVRILKEAGMNL